MHRVLPGMEAAFVSIGLERDAFLYVEDVLPPALDGLANGDGAVAVTDRPDRPRIDSLVRRDRSSWCR